MRVLHTSDWHLGRSFHGACLLDEQAAVVDRLVEAVRDQRIDVVVVAGDLYDRALPAVDAVRLLSHALAELRGAGATVVSITGNHDSAPRVAFGAELFARAGVHLCADVAEAGRPVVVPACGGGADLVLYPVPYLEPEVARHHLGAPHVRSHEGLLGIALDRARRDLAGRGPVHSLAVAHAFVAGGTACDSERVLAVGGTDRVGVAALDGFDYVALGHLHGRQTFGEGRVRYAGSPLAYSFSEREQVKGVWVVDLSAGDARVEGVDLAVGRPLASLRGTLEQLLTDRAHVAAERARVDAVLTDQVLPREAMARLRLRFPHAARLAHEPPVTPGGGGQTYAERVRGRTDLELLDGFVTHVTGQPLDGSQRDDCTAAIDAVAHEAVA